MTISETSYIRKPPINLTPKQVLVFNGIQYSIDICDLTYERLKDNLYQLSFPKNNQPVSFPTIFSDVWAIINNVTIFHNIITRHFNIKKEDLIFEKIRKIALLRNSNQHIDERIDEILLEKELPIYGTLSWYAKKEPSSTEGIIVTIYSGTITNKKSSNMTAVNPVGKTNNQRINTIEFSTIIKANNIFEKMVLKLNDLMIDIKIIIEYFEQQLEEQFKEYEPLERHKNDLLLTLFVKNNL